MLLQITAYSVLHRIVLGEKCLMPYTSFARWLTVTYLSAESTIYIFQTLPVGWKIKRTYRVETWFYGLILYPFEITQCENHVLSLLTAISLINADKVHYVKSASVRRSLKHQIDVLNIRGILWLKCWWPNLSPSQMNAYRILMVMPGFPRHDEYQHWGLQIRSTCQKNGWVMMLSSENHAQGKFYKLPLSVRLVVKWIDIGVERMWEESDTSSDEYLIDFCFFFFFFFFKSCLIFCALVSFYMQINTFIFKPA